MIEDLKKSHQQDKEHLESEYKKTIVELEEQLKIAR